MKRMKRFSTGRAGRKGVALIITLAVLVLLALLGITFATLTGIERGISQNRVDEVRAKMLASTGVEDAISRLKDMLSSGLFSGTNIEKAYEYWGDNTAEQEGAGNKSTPIEEAKNPSFAYENEEPQNPTDANVSPKLIKIDGKDRGISGFMNISSYGRHSDIYTVKVKDTSGCIFINDGLSQGPNSPTTQNLKRILNVLGSLPAVNVTGLGDLIVTNRPSGGWRNKYELLNVAGIDADKFNKFKDFITTNAWVDQKVVNPVPLSAETLKFYPMGQYYYRGTPPVYRYGSSGTSRGINYMGQPFNMPLVFWPDGGQMYSGSIDNAIWGLDELNPVWIETTSRAPVNINTASKEVLVALLANLQGFFMVERRRNFPVTNSTKTTTVNGFEWLDKEMHYDTTDDPAGFSAIGFLYTTVPIVSTTSSEKKTTTGSSISAESIADEIVYCRTKGKSPLTGIDYSAVGYGGKFKSWVQFNLFCDGLVGKLLKDERNIYYDYDPQTGTEVSPAVIQQEYAAKAIADVLKANFNPNVHLNELNPDMNMFLRVDKTDLLVNSTEFSFTPMGYFEIESLGQVLKPTGTTGDSWTAPDNNTRGQKKIIATIKLFDVYRETTQSDFYKGEIAKRQGIVTETNNNKPLEIGPEVQQGPLPANANFGGYVMLSSIGGDFTPDNVDSEKLKDAYVNTPTGGKWRNSELHSHFSNDFDAHYSASTSLGGDDRFRKNVSNINLEGEAEKNSFGYPVPSPNYPIYDPLYRGPGNDGPYAFKTGTPGKYPKIEFSNNFPDKTEAKDALPPYSPVSSRGGELGAYRLARSFRMPDYGSKSSVMPTLDLIPPSNLRLDGAFIERNSGIAYWLDEGYNWDSMHGVMSFWVKPSFYPEMAGKPRIFMSAARWHWMMQTYWGAHQDVRPTPFTLFFLPAHDSLPNTTSDAENMLTVEPDYDAFKGAGRFRPSSLMFWYSFDNSAGYNADYGDIDTSFINEAVGITEVGKDYGIIGGVNTPSLNHMYHKHQPVAKRVWGITGYDRRRRPIYGWKWINVDIAADNWLRGHNWSHVAFKWTANEPNSDTTSNMGIYSTNGTPQNTWDIWINGQSIADTKGFWNKKLEGPIRRPHFTVHSFEWRDGAARHISEGQYRTTTIMVKQQRRRYAYRQEPYTVEIQDPNGPIVRTETYQVQTGTRTVTATRRVLDGYDTTTVQVRVLDHYEQQTQTRRVWKQVGSHKETVTITRQVPDGVEWVWDPSLQQLVQRKKYKTITETKEIDVPDYAWVTETVTVQVPVYRYEERQAQVPRYRYENYTYDVPTYEWRTREVRYRQEQRIRWRYYYEYYYVDVPTPYTTWVVTARPATKVMANTLRLGETSTHNLPHYPRNWSADATIDELYLWKGGDQDRQQAGRWRYGRFYAYYPPQYNYYTGANVTEALNVWKLGRYYNPQVDGEAVFTSQGIDLNIIGSYRRNMPSPSTVAAPEGGSVGSVAPKTTSTSPYKLLGISWTWFGEGVNPTSLEPEIYDYSTNQINPVAIYPRVEVAMVVDGKETLSYTDSVYTPLLDANNMPISVSDPKNVKYKVYFRVNAAANAILLGTPVFDDITIFLDSGGPQVVSYVIL